MARMSRSYRSLVLLSGALGLLLSGCAEVRSAPPAPEIVEIAPDGAWTWFNDERAVRLENGNLLVGYVRSDGRIAVTNYDPDSGERHETVLGGEGAIEIDDHNNPSLTQLPDGRVLAIYSRHHTDPHFFWRISTTANPRSEADWGAERMKEVGARNTYANTFLLQGENDRIFNFQRSINFNPALVLSDDLGESWSDPIHFITAGSGRQRPYPRYTSNGVDRIDLIYTDAHPRDLNNSIYHLYYREGAFRGSDGTELRRLEDLPIAHDEGERGSVIYRFSEEPWGEGEGPDDWIPGGRGWTWDVAYDTDQHPVAVFQVRRGEVTGDGWADARIYYYYARWTGEAWDRHFIAQAGRPLYDREEDYGGGMTLDPRDSGVVYISSNAARPFDLSDLDDVPLAPGDRYTLYRGETRDGGRTFTWTEIEVDGEGDNLRPHAVDGALVWFQGRYGTYTDFAARVLSIEF